MKETMECMVVSVDQKMAKVRQKMHSDCSNCGLCEGSNTVYYEAINPVNAACGQSVIVEIEKQNILYTAFMVFVLPLIVIAVGSMLGIFIAGYIHVSDILAAVVVSVIALIPTFICIRKYDSKVQSKSTTPVITKIINE
jgi:sigma-E factor negative regulatory protein RseC